MRMHFAHLLHAQADSKGRSIDPVATVAFGPGIHRVTGPSVAANLSIRRSDHRYAKAVIVFREAGVALVVITADGGICRRGDHGAGIAIPPETQIVRPVTTLNQRGALRGACRLALHQADGLPVTLGRARQRAVRRRSLALPPAPRPGFNGLRFLVPSPVPPGRSESFLPFNSPAPDLAARSCRAGFDDFDGLPCLVGPDLFEGLPPFSALKSDCFGPSPRSGRD